MGSKVTDVKMPPNTGLQPTGFASPERQDTVHVVQLGEHLAVEEQEGAEGLVLCRSSDVFLDRQVGEKGFDLGIAHFGRVAHAVQVGVPLDPADVGLLGAIGIEADGAPSASSGQART